MSGRLLATALLLAAALAASAVAQGGAETPDGAPSREELILRRQLGVLTYVHVSLDFDRTPARRAFDQLAAVLGIPMIGRYSGGGFDDGIDPQAPITLTLAGIPALDALEQMLEACSTPESPCTWQMRKGFVEFGTKSRLSVPAARRLRVYNIADLMIDIPENPLVRTRREVYALDVVEAIVETIEPGQWDWGQAESDDVEPPAREVQPQGPPPAAARRTREMVYVPPRKIASIRYWRDFLIVSAPDYIHRQINGYPDPIPPAAAPPRPPAEPR